MIASRFQILLGASGIGVEGQFGVRIGDSVAVTDSGFEYLTDYPRGLTVL